MVDLARGWSRRTIAAARRVLTRRIPLFPRKIQQNSRFWFDRGPTLHKQVIERTVLYGNFRYVTKQRNFSAEQRN
jgi:hypothetical protein